MLNHITITGNLTADPELRKTGSGIPTCSFTVACERDRRGPNGEKEVDFIDCVAWRKDAEFVAGKFKKSSGITVSGRLQIRNWVDKQENKRRTAEIDVENVYFADARPSVREG